MVLYNQAPVQYLSHPGHVTDKDKVWVMSQTGEIFLDYSSYLNRRDFYLQHKFTCEATGTSGLSFFDALDSEIEGNRLVKGNFPEPLQEPVLRKVQFSTLPRIDDLVNLVFDEFRSDFYPGETVLAAISPGNTAEGIIREKTTIKERRGADGTVLSEAASHYFVRISARPGHLRETFLESRQLSRDRHHFTKPLLKSFLKHSLTRDPWQGAPWNILNDVARQFHISTDYPTHMRRGQIAARRHASSRIADVARNGPNYQAGYDGRNGVELGQNHTAQSQSLAYHLESPVPPAPPPIKYPIEDLDIPGGDTKRPVLKIWGAPEEGSQDQSDEPELAQLDQKYIGPLLEVWNLLNIYREVFLLDSFTFDNIYDAIRVYSDATPCELFTEIHCGILCQLVNPQGVLLVDLPEDESDVDESGEDREGEEGEEGEEPEANKVTLSTTNSDDEAEINTPHSHRSGRHRGSAKGESFKGLVSSEQLNSDSHRAVDLVQEYNWIDMLQARDFHTGGWEVIIAGLLCQLSLDENFRPRCDEILSHLTPLDTKPTHQSVRANYYKLHPNLRVAILEILGTLAIQTKAIRDFIEQCGEKMTEYRKEKIEHQRRRKILFEEVREADEHRRTLRQEIAAITDCNPIVPVLDIGGDEKMDEDGKDEDDEAPTRLSKLANERKRKRDEEKARKELENKLSKPELALKKLDSQVEKKLGQVKECEVAINNIDERLRESNIQRTRFLGRDRYWNKYYWFERNGMPFAPSEAESSFPAGYMNGRLWVQGPDRSEIDGFLNLSPSECEEYTAKIGEAMATRKEREENGTTLDGPDSWGYIDDPVELNKLIHEWLDERGIREKSLLKELRTWQDNITACMEAVKRYKASLKATEAEPEESVPPQTRSSSRLKSANNQGDTGEGPLVQKWMNNTARARLGFLHGDGKVKKQNSKKNGQKGGASSSSRAKPRNSGR